MADVIRLHPDGSLAAQRAEALLGSTPTLTFQPDAGEGGACCSVRLVRAAGGVWLGLVRDRGLFAERARLGARPSFVVHHEGETPVMCGEAEVRVRGRLGCDAGDAGDADEALRRLLELQPFSTAELAVIEVRLSSVRIDDGEAPLHGAIPRT